MKKNTIIKIILIIFFTIFFGFLFWFFYDPQVKEDGTVKREVGFFESLFPFNNSEDGEDKNKEKDVKKKKEEEKEEEEFYFEKIPRLRQISKIPTSAAFIEKISKLEIFDINKDKKKKEKIPDNGEYSEIRYVAMKNSNVYQTYDFTLGEKRISNMGIPKILETLFFDKDNFVVRYKNNSDILKTFVISLYDKIINEDEKKDSNKEKSLLKSSQGLFFPDNIEDFKINQEKDLVFYTSFTNREKKKDGKIHGILTNKKSENKKEIFSSELKELNFSFNNSKNIFMSTKNSADSDSVAFSIDTKNAKLKRVISGTKSLNGLPNKDFSIILYSQKSKYGKYILQTHDKNGKFLKEFNFSTFIEKCVWSKNNIDFYCAVPRKIKGIQPDD
jgi:hypothetical protein